MNLKGDYMKMELVNNNMILTAENKAERIEQGKFRMNLKKAGVKFTTILRIKNSNFITTIMFTRGGYKKFKYVLGESHVIKHD